MDFFASGAQNAFKIIVRGDQLSICHHDAVAERNVEARGQREGDDRGHDEVGVDVDAEGLGEGIAEEDDVEADGGSTATTRRGR